MSDSVASTHMRRWGIPESVDKNSAPEISLLERLVWVRYQSHWWPALLYHSYTELQHHLYDQLDMVLKAQFAMAIMRHMQENRQVKVARLLGRPILEVIEVEKGCYTEFYWQLPHVLPKACNKSQYGKDVELYYDFHRALDQVEDIIRDVSQENFALMPHMEQQSWLERSQIMDNTMHGDRHSFSRNRSLESKSTMTSNTNSSQQSYVPSHNHDDMSRDSYGNHQENNKSTPDDGKRHASRTPSRSRIPSQRASIASAAKDFVATHTDGQRRASRSRSRKPPPSATSLPMDAEDAASRHSKISRKSSRSHKTRGGVSQAGTEVAGNLSSTPALVEIRDQPASSRIANKGFKVEPANSRDEMADKTDREGASDAREGEKSMALVLLDDPVHLLPGLEGDDISPGLSQTVNHARDIWTGVWETLLMSKEQAPKQSTKPTLDTSAKKEFVHALAAQGTVAEEADEIVKEALENLTLWERMTTCATAECSAN
jgi:hypothetical protein